MKQWLNKYHWVILALTGLSFYAPLTINTIALVMCLLVVILRGQLIDSFKALKQNPFGLFAIALYFWCALSILWSTDKETGTEDILARASLLLVPLFFSAWKLNADEIGKVLKTFIYGSLAITLYSIAAAAFAVIYYPKSFASRFEGFTYEHLSYHSSFQPIYLSLYIISAIFFSLWVSGEEQSIKKRAFIILTFFVFLVLLASRMEIMVFFFVFSIVTIIWGKQKGRLKQVLLLSAGLVVICFALVMSNNLTRTRFTEMFSSNYENTQYGGTALRIAKWQNTVDCWKQYPVIGTGIGDYHNELQATYLKNNFTIGYDHKYNSHNQFLQTLLGTGLIGLLLLLAMLFSGLRMAWKSANWLAVIFIVVFLLSCITESMLERQRGIVFFIFFSTLLLNSALNKVDKKL